MGISSLSRAYVGISDSATSTALTIDASQNVVFTGTVDATSYSGAGTNVTSLTAANISTGNLVSGVLEYSTASAGASNYKVPFLNTTGDASGNFATYFDSGTSEFTYNPSTNTLIAGTFSGALTGNASTASTAAAWTTTRTIDISGDVSSDAVNIDGSGNVTITNTVVANDSHTHDATNLTGTTLASGVVASSLTSVGTLTSLSAGAITSTGIVQGTSFSGGTTGSGQMIGNETASATNPTIIPYKGDIDTGLGGDNANGLYLITGGSTTLTLDSSQNATFAGQARPSTGALTYNATQTWDCNTQDATLTLTGNVTTFSAPTNQVAGTWYALRVNVGTGPYSVAAWNAVFKFAAGTAPTLTTTASAIDILTFRSDGTNMELTGIQQDVK